MPIFLPVSMRFLISLVDFTCRPALHLPNKPHLIDRQICLGRGAISRDFRIRDTIGAEIMDVKKDTEKRGEISRRVDIAEFLIVA
jgi:hypothetical protein